MPRHIIPIDYAELFDLRVDAAFKIYFASGDTSRLVSLLNAIFANKGLRRKVVSLTIGNPNLERKTDEDKKSILDILANLSDGAVVCIEMHLYERGEIVFKAVRSTARTYGEGLSIGEKYSEQSGVISIVFVNGPIADASGSNIEKVHSLVQLTERDDHWLLTENIEMHFINMKAFLKSLGVPKNLSMSAFDKWLALITHHEIKNKMILDKIREEEEFDMAAAALLQMSQDTVARLTYARRQDELHTWNILEREVRENKLRAEESERRAEESKRQAEESKQIAEESKLMAEESKLRAEESERIALNTIRILWEQGLTLPDIIKALGTTLQKVEELVSTYKNTNGETDTTLAMLDTLIAEHHVESAQ